MDQQNTTEIETRIQALLAGDVSPKERDELLARIATDELARKTLAEMIRCRNAARRAFGYNGADAAINPPVEDILLATEGRASGRPGRRTLRPVVKIRWASLFWPAAAAAAIAVAIYFGLRGQDESSAIRDQIAKVNQAVAQWQMTAKELAGYQKVWDEIAASSERRSPWILLRDGGGRFEYLPATGTGPQAEPMIVRCLLVSQDGTVAETVNLLLPAHRPLDLSLGETGQLAGLPLRCKVAAEDEWITMDVMIGRDEAEAVGVRGRVMPGREMSEIGQFKLGDRGMKVLLQAVPLSSSLG